MDKRRLKMVYIRPSRYDDDGYVVRFWRGVLPSNTLVCLDALTHEVTQSGALGDGVEVSVDLYDDFVQRIPVRKIIKASREPGTRVVVGFVGVQTNQFPRTSDLALEFRAAGIPVLIGGFHVSGVLSLFEKPSHELQHLLDHGVTLVKGEVEAPGVMSEIMRDALDGTLKPIYAIEELPDISNAPVPKVSVALQHRYFTKNMGTIDMSRGCPFDCSFCTIINVQGRKMRCRSGKRVLEAIEENYDRGVSIYLFTDDNFARNPIWEQIFDGLIEMRERGRKIMFMMQTDTGAHRIPNFVEKAAKAGCYLVSIGMESVNPENIAALGKRQNRIDDYANMVETWHSHKVIVMTGYIIGLPHDSLESLRRDIAVLRDEVKIDLAVFTFLTPMPGSKDHLRMVTEGVEIDTDLNKYDLVHATFRHPKMEIAEWEQAHREVTFGLFNPQSVTNALLRSPRENYTELFWVYAWNRYCALEGLHAYMTGFYRLKDRTSRRPVFARESFLQYGLRRLKDAGHGLRRYIGLLLEFEEIWLLTKSRNEPPFVTLAQLRHTWAAAQLRISQSRARNACSEAVCELKTILAQLVRLVRELSEAHLAEGSHVRQRLDDMVCDIEEYARSLDQPDVGWDQVAEAEHFVSERIIADFEEIAIQHVAKRRRMNEYRRRVVSRIRRGGFPAVDLVKMPLVLLQESLLFIRFLAFARTGK